MRPEMVNLSQNGLHQLWDMKEKEIFFNKTMACSFSIIQILPHPAVKVWVESFIMTKEVRITMWLVYSVTLNFFYRLSDLNLKIY